MKKTKDTKPMPMAHYQEEVRRGARWHIDLKGRTLKVDGKVCHMELPPAVPMQDALTHLEELYGVYRHSVPSARNDRRHTYFYALGLEELDDKALMYAPRRDDAQFALEATLLLYLLNGSICWEQMPPRCTWFWKSATHPDLVILREWVEGNNENENENENQNK